jgi:hypothetical protein
MLILPLDSTAGQAGMPILPSHSVRTALLPILPNYVVREALIIVSREKDTPTRVILAPGWHQSDTWSARVRPRRTPVGDNASY